MAKAVYVKKVLNKHKRDEWFLDEYSVNPYYGCDFNCVYCYTHGSKYGKSELAVKINSPTILVKELKKATLGFIALSSATEPWMNLEKKYEVTRKCLEVIERYRFPVHCLTKSTLILRNLELLSEIDKRAILPEDLKIDSGVLITFSFSTLDEKIAKIFEPNAPKPKNRLETLWKIKEEDLTAGLALIPALPFISDSSENLEEFIKVAKEFRADYVFVGSLTHYKTPLFFRTIERHFPELLDRYKKLDTEKLNIKLQVETKKLCDKYGISFRLTC